MRNLAQIPFFGCFRFQLLRERQLKKLELERKKSKNLLWHLSLERPFFRSNRREQEKRRKCRILYECSGEFPRFFCQLRQSPVTRHRLCVAISASSFTPLLHAHLQRKTFNAGSDAWVLFLHINSNLFFSSSSPSSIFFDPFELLGMIGMSDLEARTGGGVARDFIDKIAKILQFRRQVGAKPQSRPNTYIHLYFYYYQYFSDLNPISWSQAGPERAQIVKFCFERAN